MSREKLVKSMKIFHGKRIDNGEWVYGWYAPLVCNDKTMIPNIKDYNGSDWKVDSDTIGQYTGLTDKNDNMIFEGDIIRTITLDTGMECLAVVCFGNFIDENNGDEYIGFYIEFDGIKTTAAQLAMKECKNRIEIIGNIYDNPELLEVEE